MQKKITEQYYISVGKEIQSQFDRVLSLVDDARLASGEWKEQLIRNYLIKYLPKRFAVGRGYIKNPYTKTCSKQIDIIIYDQLTYAPYFQDRDLVILPPESVVAVIEIKSGIKKKDLKKFGDEEHEVLMDLYGTLKNIETAKKVRDRSIHTRLRLPFSFIIFTDSIWEDYNDFGNSLACWPEKLPEDLYPEAIICWSKYIAWTFHQEPGYVKIGQIKPDDDISFPFFFGLLNQYLMTWQKMPPEGKRTWAEHMRANYFDFEHPTRGIFEPRGVKIGGGVIDVPDQKPE